MRRVLIFALAMGAGLGCKKKDAVDPAAPAVPSLAGDPTKGAPAVPGVAPAPAGAPDVTLKHGDTNALWALAPADATFGVVIADGVGPRVLDIVNRARKQLEGKPFAKKVLDEFATWPTKAGFDVFDPAACKTQGWDIGQGLAVFGGNSAEPLLFVMPVADIHVVQKNVTDLQDGTFEKVGDREIFKGKKAVCTTFGERYACAQTLEALDAAFKPHDSPLAQAVKALPAEARGDLEGYVDIAKTKDIASEMDDIKQFGDFTTAGGAIRIDKPGMNMYLWANGALTPMATSFAAAPPPAEFAGMTGNATTVLRAKIDPKLLLAQVPADAPIGAFGAVDLRKDLLEKLTGDIQVVTAGKGLLAGALMFKVSDPAPVKKVIAAVCEEVKRPQQGLPISGVVAKEDSCTGEISLAMLKDAIGAELPPYKFHLAVAGNVFLIVLGDLDPASLKGSVVDEVGSPEARQALSGAQSFVVWSRGMTFDLGALPKELHDKLAAQADVADALALMNWSGSQVYDFSMAAGLTPTGVKMTVHSTAMDADPADVRAAHQAAFDKRLSGDRAGYTAAMAEIEKKFPASLAARMARLERVGTPLAGPVLGLVGAGGAAFFAMAQGMGAAPLPIEPPPGGSFGEPGAQGAPGGDKPEGGEGEKPPAETPPAPAPSPEPAPAPAPDKPTP